MIDINLFNGEKVVWEVDPYLKKLFKGIYAFDKNEVKTSDILTAIALVNHHDSKYADMEVTMRIAQVEEDLEIKYSPIEKQFAEEINKFIEVSTTKERRIFDRWKKKLDELDDFIDSNKIDFDNIEIILKILEKKPKLWESYLAAKKMAEATEDGTVMGGGELSLLERGSI